MKDVQLRQMSKREREKGYGLLLKEGEKLTPLQPKEEKPKRNWNLFFGRDALRAGILKLAKSKKRKDSAEECACKGSAGKSLATTLMREIEHSAHEVKGYRLDFKKNLAPQLNLFNTEKRGCVAIIDGRDYDIYARLINWQHVEMREAIASPEAIMGNAGLRACRDVIYVTRKGVLPPEALESLGKSPVYAAVMLSGRKEIAAGNLIGRQARSQFLKEFASWIDGLRGLSSEKAKPLDNLRKSWVALKGEKPIYLNAQRAPFGSINITIVFEQFYTSGKSVLADIYIALWCEMNRDMLADGAKKTGRKLKRFLGSRVEKAFGQIDDVVGDLRLSHKHRLVLFGYKKKPEADALGAPHMLGPAT